jgi:carbonic anhydrase
MFSPPVVLIRPLMAASLGLLIGCLCAPAAAADSQAHGFMAEDAKNKGVAQADATQEQPVEAKAKAKAKAKLAREPAPAAEGKPVHKAGAAPEPKAGAPRAAKAAPRDVMDVLRERLAEKLGATPSPDTQGLRVATRSPAPAGSTGPVAVAALAPRAAGHSAGGSPSAARLAAAHRQSAAAAASPHGATSDAAHWDYKGDAGPQSWGKLKPEFAQCATGTRQSPIDIRDGIKVELDAVRFDYKPSHFRVIDNGHTVQVNVAAGNSIEIIGRRYELLQFHFHRPSEERINGRLFDMVAHLVHKDMEGRLAVIAVLLDRGSAHPLIQTVWNNLPLEKGEELAARIALDLNALLPADRSYFTYMGSLTTPPCSEGVLWMVMKEPVTISAEQIGIFSRLYPMNARPVQSASGRLIKESN